MDRFFELKVFVEVIETGSLSQAADQLGVAKSAVRRTLKALKSRLGVQLTVRTTRRQNLTDAGAADDVLTATPLENAIRHQAIADSVAGHPDAKAAWPGYAMHEDIRKMTSRIEVPTMLLTGEHDRVDSPVVLARRLVPYLPDPEIHKLPGVGHLLPLETPTGVAAHIARYLNKLANMDGSNKT